MTKILEQIKALPDDAAYVCTFKAHLGESGDMLMIEDLKAFVNEHEEMRHWSEAIIKNWDADPTLVPMPKLRKSLSGMRKLLKVSKTSIEIP